MSTTAESNPPLLPWDPTRPYVMRSDAGADFFNAGCPVGYFAEVVPLSFPGSVNVADIGNPAAGLVCRSVESATPEQLVADSVDYSVENMTRFNGAVLDGMPGTTSWAILFVIGLFVWDQLTGKGKRV